MSSALRDFPYAGILFLPFVMVSVSSASDSFCTSAVWKSWAPIFFPIPESLPSAPGQPAHFDLKSVSDALCACAYRGRLRTTANAVVTANTGTSILFICKLHPSSSWPNLGRSSTNRNIELFEDGVSVIPITRACNRNVLGRLALFKSIKQRAAPHHGAPAYYLHAASSNSRTPISNTLFPTFSLW